jgi:hypothetical protein
MGAPGEVAGFFAARRPLRGVAFFVAKATNLWEASLQEG